jgi:hypothetical protein
MRTLHISHADAEEAEYEGIHYSHRDLLASADKVELEEVDGNGHASMSMDKKS